MRLPETVSFLTMVLLLTPPIAAQVRERDAGGGVVTAQAKEVKDAKQEPERLALDRLTGDMVRAFERRDAEAIASHWIEKGEFIRDDGEPIRGRDEIQKGYAEFFKTLKGSPEVQVRSDSVRILSADLAVADVTLQLKNDDGRIQASGRQSIVAVREDGLWKVALIREWDHDVDQEVDLHELEWLIGTWQAVAEDRDVTITYAWDENRSFIRGRFTVKEGSKVIESGTEMIGMDRAAGAIRSWVFQSDGGFGGGVWSREGRTWSIDVHGVRADSSELAATILYVLVDPDTLTWQAVHQAINGVPVADTTPVKVTRQKVSAAQDASVPSGSSKNRENER